MNHTSWLSILKQVERDTEQFPHSHEELLPYVAELATIDAQLKTQENESKTLSGDLKL